MRDFVKDIQGLFPTRYNRVSTYLSSLEKNIIIKGKTDKQIVEDSHVLIERISSKLSIYTTINAFLYLAIYVSVLPFFITNFIILSELAQLISRVVSVFGTAIFLIGLYFSNRMIELYYQDLNLITAHLISVYSKYQREAIDELGENAGNYYQVFIEFFKSKYGEKK